MATWKATTFQDYMPDEGAVNEQFADDSARVERTIRVRWEDRHQARVDFLGYAEVREESGTKWISRSVPHAYEDVLNADNLPWLYARSVSRTAPRGPRSRDSQGNTSTGGPNYREALLTLTYTSLSYDILPDTHPSLQLGLGTHPDEAALTRYITRTYRPFTRMITLPRNLMKWVLESGDKGFGLGGKAPLVTEGIGKNESGILLEYTHHCRPDLPRERILQALGRVNDDTFDDVFPAGSLLCESPEIKPYISPLGDRIYDITFRFRFLPKVKNDNTIVGHNWFLRCFETTSGTPVRDLDYRLLTTTGDAGGTAAFQEFDFDSLFRPE